MRDQRSRCRSFPMLMINYVLVYSFAPPLLARPSVSVTIPICVSPDNKRGHAASAATNCCIQQQQHARLQNDSSL